MGLEIRNWTCPVCHSEHDRDINAAINVKNEGLRILDNGMERNSKTLDSYSSMPVENPTMDERLLDLKSSDSMSQELLYKDSTPNGEGPVL